MLYFTVRSTNSSKAVLALDLKLGKPISAIKLPTDQELEIESSKITVPLESDEVAVVEVRR